jgi:hypothetical protein
MSLKTYIKILTVSAAMLFSFVAISQVKVTGYVFAEVVESVSATSNAITNIQTQISPGGTNKNIDLGSITLNSGTNLSYNVMMTNTSISDSKGDQLDMQIYSANSDKSIVEIKGKIADNNSVGQFKGSYTMIFAYN